MNSIPLLVNDKTLVRQGEAMDYHGVYYAPVREIFDTLGGYSAWQARENQVVVRWANHLVVIPAAGTVITLNGDRKVMEHPSRQISNQLCVPLECFAAAFSGSLTREENGLSLFLPVGHLSGVRIEGEALHLRWTAEGEVDAELRGSKLVMRLKDTTWPTALKRVLIERQPGGWLGMLVETSGGELTHSVGEYGVRVEWKGSQSKKLAGLTFAVDAGHGGSDLGAVGPAGILEKDIARLIADILIAELMEAGAGVIDVRPQDQRVSLEERVSSVQKGGASILVSIHLKGHERVSANGTETFHLEGNNKGSLLAEVVQEYLTASLKLRNRGVKQAAFYLLRAFPELPAIITEIGFITNPEEECFLSNPVNQAAAARAIFHGLLKYVEDNRSFLVG